MIRYKVTVTYEMIVFAESENEAVIVADGSIGYTIQHPQTYDVIQPDIEVEEFKEGTCEECGGSGDNHTEGSVSSDCPVCGGTGKA